MPRAFATLIAAMSFSSAHAVVVSDSQILLTPSTAFGASYAITAIQSSTYYDPTTMWFSKQDSAGKSTLKPITWNVDQEADYYLAAPGAIFTPDTISAGQFKPLFILDKPYILDVPFPGDFYLGVATSGPGPVPGGTPPSGIGRNVWGWVHLTNGASGLSILGSAMAYGEGGIIIGKTTPVPEPGTLLLLAIGFTGLTLAGRQNRSSVQAR
jgi:PEP-CTERM motif